MIKTIFDRFTEQLNASPLPPACFLQEPHATGEKAREGFCGWWPGLSDAFTRQVDGVEETGGAGREGEGCVHRGFRQERDRLAGEVWGKTVQSPPLGAECPPCPCLGLQGWGHVGTGRDGWQHRSPLSLPLSQYCLVFPTVAGGSVFPHQVSCSQRLPSHLGRPPHAALLSKLRIYCPLWSPLLPLHLVQGDTERGEPHIPVRASHPPPRPPLIS